MAPPPDALPAVATVTDLPGSERGWCRSVTDLCRCDQKRLCGRGRRSRPVGGAVAKPEFVVAGSAAEATTDPLPSTAYARFSHWNAVPGLAAITLKVGCRLTGIVDAVTGVDRGQRVGAHAQALGGDDHCPHCCLWPLPEDSRRCECVACHQEGHGTRRARWDDCCCCCVAR